MIDEQDILAVRMEAAVLEREAAELRLHTAKIEADSALRTIALSEQVAQSMMDRQFSGKS